MIILVYSQILGVMICRITLLQLFGWHKKMFFATTYYYVEMCDIISFLNKKFLFYSISSFPTPPPWSYSQNSIG